MAYTVPTAADLKAYYPAFTSVSDDTINLYIARVSGASGADVDQSWTEGDYGPAIMAAAAHRMARAGVIGGGSGSVNGTSGVERFRSGSVDVSFNADAVKQSLAGGWSSTSYGQDYIELLARNRGGPRVTGGGYVDCNASFNGFAGPVPPWQC